MSDDTRAYYCNWLYQETARVDTRIVGCELAVDATPGLSRRALARQVCEWLEWRGVNGRLQDMSCRKALARLDRDGRIKLPECAQTYAFQAPATPHEEPVSDLAEVSCSLAKLGEVVLWPVSSRYSQDSHVWNDLMSRFHPRGKGPLCGGSRSGCSRSAATSSPTPKYPCPKPATARKPRRRPRIASSRTSK